MKGTALWVHGDGARGQVPCKGTMQGDSPVTLAGDGSLKEVSSMKIAIIGAGGVGATLGRAFANRGHKVAFGVRRPDDPAYGPLRALQNTTVTTASDAVSASEIAVLAVPGSAAAATVGALGPLLDGKVLVDATNPIRADFTGLEQGPHPSAAQSLAALVPSCHVVKAFNTASTETMADPRYPEGPAVMIVCGDDPASTERIAALATEIGFEGIAAGPLALAEQLEQLAWLYIHLALKTGLGRSVAFRIARRT